VILPIFPATASVARHLPPVIDVAVSQATVLNLTFWWQPQELCVMNGSHRITAAVTGCFLLLAQTIAASASTLSLDTGKALELQPGGSGVFTFTATTGAQDIEDFVFWAIGFQVVPTGSVAGTLSLGVPPGALPITSPVGTDFDALTNPVVNPILNDVTGFDFAQPKMLTLASSGTINGLTNFIGMGATAVDDIPLLSANTQYGVGSVSFSASADAQGSWTVFAVQQQGGSLKTYWIDEFNQDRPFENIPFASGGNYAIPIGTISVVPEPSSLVLAASAVVAAAGFGWRRRRRNLVMLEA